jgi:hypothetical protein
LFYHFLTPLLGFFNPCGNILYHRKPFNQKGFYYLRGSYIYFRVVALGTSYSPLNTSFNPRPLHNKFADSTASRALPL